MDGNKKITTNSTLATSAHTLQGWQMCPWSCQIPSLFTPCLSWGSNCVQQWALQRHWSSHFHHDHNTVFEFRHFTKLHTHFFIHKNFIITSKTQDYAQNSSQRRSEDNIISSQGHLLDNDWTISTDNRILSTQYFHCVLEYQVIWDLGISFKLPHEICVQYNQIKIC
jgi:hypothetical protein